MSRSPSRSREQLRIVALLVASVCLVAWFFLSSASSPTVAPPQNSAPSGTASAPPTSAIAPGAPSSGSTVAPLDPLKEQSAESARTALAEYLKFSEYPAWSRPYDESQRHVLHWNELPETGQAFTHDKAGGPISAELQLDRLFAGPGDVITATAIVFRGAYDVAKRATIPALVEGEIQVWQEGKAGSNPEDPGWPAVHKVAFVANDGPLGRTYVAKFQPSTIAALSKSPADARFVAWVTAEGHRFPFSSTFRYAASRPIVILPGHSDKLVNGSLEVLLAIDVKQLGPVMFQAVLFDAAGKEPIATYDNYYRPAQLGPQEAKLVFIGKAIHEKGIDGPYSIRALHGHVRVADADPPEVFWAHETPIPTESYRATDFSAAEWDSVEKQAKINQYKALITSLEGK